MVRLTLLVENVTLSLADQRAFKLLVFTRRAWIIHARESAWVIATHLLQVRPITVIPLFRSTCKCPYLARPQKAIPIHLNVYLRLGYSRGYRNRKCYIFVHIWTKTKLESEMILMLFPIPVPLGDRVRIARQTNQGFVLQDPLNMYGQFISRNILLNKVRVAVKLFYI